MGSTAIDHPGDDGRAPDTGRGRGLTAALTAAAIALTGAATALATAGTPAPPPPPPAAAAPASAPTTADARSLPRAAPIRLRVPSLGIDTALLPLALAPDGTLTPPPPEQGDTAGWYAAGTSPGEKGTAIITGHVDTPDGPAVFYPLSRLRPGAAVTVDRADGTTAAFTVDRVVNYPKAAVPDEVYAPAARPELRLITCGGPFDRTRGGYQDNTVVYAHLAG
ncbi:class F sortase [Kitasatospora sp. NPDC057198]|uniref:class F sortase n=1 Tax=Kitasatospora sp. NPDC057198 TaxID=3346046 RepID=UPI0036288220